MASSRGEGLEGLDKVGAEQRAATALVQCREVSRTVQYFSNQ